MNRKEAFAHFLAAAPEHPPEWFKPSIQPEKIAAPDWDIKGQSDRVKKLASQWRMDPIFDLSVQSNDQPAEWQFTEEECKALADYEKAWKEYWLRSNESARQYRIAVFLEWRRLYAEMMMAEWSKAVSGTIHNGHFVVISHCEDQDQTFFDFIKAETPEEAAAIGQIIRGEYSTYLQTLDINDISGWINIMERPETFEHWISQENLKQKMEEYGQEWPEEGKSARDLIVMHVAEIALDTGKDPLPYEFKCWAFDCKHQFRSSRRENQCPKCRGYNVTLIPDYMGLSDPVEDSDHLCDCGDPDCSRPLGHDTDDQ